VIERVLVLDDHHEQLCRPLTQRFPQIRFDGFNDAAKAAVDCASADAFIAIAPFITRTMIDNAPRLSWIQALSTGTDTLEPLLDCRTEIVVTSARGIAAAAVAEFALLTMLALGRRFSLMLSQQAERTWRRARGDTLAGRTVTIVGVGTIAEALASRCRALGMHTIGVSASRTSAPSLDRILARDELATAAGLADYLVLTVPLAPETRRLVNADVIAAMKQSAYLVNVARGGVLDHEALVNALRSDRIAGAALDVFDVEPMPPEHSLWSMSNLIVTPHAAGDVRQLNDLMLPLIEHNLEALINGSTQHLRNVVRPRLEVRKPDRMRCE
jgi:D-2-hydroxyacid dehydrogenase (NADP+)